MSAADELRFHPDFMACGYRRRVITVPSAGRLRPGIVLLVAAGSAVMGLLAVAGVVAAVVLVPAPRHQHATAHAEPTYQRLIYQQVCGKLDAGALAAGFGTVDPESTSGAQDATGFGCQLLGSTGSGVNTIDVRVSYLDTATEARAAVTTAYPKLAKAKDVSRLQHVRAGDGAFAFLCAGGATSDGCAAANRATAAFPATDSPDNYALASAASRNARFTVAAQDDNGHFDAATGPAAVTAVTAFLQRNLPLLAAGPGTTPVFLAGHKDNVDSLAFNPQGTMLASGDAGGTVRVWDVATHRTVHTLTSPDGAPGIVFAVAFSPDGKTLATGRSDGTILLWDVGTGRLTATLPSNYTLIESLSFSPDGRTLASGGDIGMDGAIRLWDVAGRRVLSTLGHGITNSVAFSPDGSTLASGSANGVQLWNVATRQPTTLVPDTGAYYALAYSRDGRTLAVGSDGTHNVRLFDVATHRVTATLADGTDGPYHSVSFSPDGKTVASVSNRNGIELWDTTTGKLITTYPGDGPVTFAPTGTTLASTLTNHYVLLWP